MPLKRAREKNEKMQAENGDNIYKYFQRCTHCVNSEAWRDKNVPQIRTRWNAHTHTLRS